MINLFKKKKTQKELIEEVHNSFYSEVDSLLKEAQITKNAPELNETLKNKAERLRKMGFRQTSECNSFYQQQNALSEIENENKQKAGLVNAIKYFSEKYPQYKFITQDSISKICEKYGLIWGKPEQYISDIPEYNLQQIENFKIQDVDCVYNENRMDWPECERSYHYAIECINKFKRDHSSNMVHADLLSFRSWDHTRNISFEKQPFSIVATEKDFNTKGHRVVGNKLIKDDPIVLFPVMHNEEVYYLIVTAWGIEAKDPLVINPKNN